MGPLPRTANGKLYILVAIDYMTRWVEAQSVAKVNEKTVSKFVYTHICCRFGTPLEIVSDNGLGFRRGLLTEVCEELKISHRHSTPYYPQSNGLVEKANGIIAGIIRKMVESKPKRWDNFLDGAIWAYRTTYRDATQFTLFHLVYGQEALQPIELNIPTIKLTGRQEQNNDEAWIDRLLNLVELEWKREAAYHCYKKKALQLKDKLNEGIKDKEIKEKSLVLRYNNALDNRFDAKFERRWEGPFIVKKAFTGGYYQLMDLNGKEHPRKVNGYRLKPYLSRIFPAVFETKQVSKKTKKAWDILASLYAEAKIALLHKELESNIMNEEDDMDTFLAGVKDINEQLIFACEVISNNSLVQIVHDALPDSYQTFASTWRLMNQKILEVVKFDEVCTLLLQERVSTSSTQKLNRLSELRASLPQKKESLLRLEGSNAVTKKIKEDILLFEQRLDELHRQVPCDIDEIKDVEANLNASKRMLRRLKDSTEIKNLALEMEIEQNECVVLKTKCVEAQIQSEFVRMIIAKINEGRRIQGQRGVYGQPCCRQALQGWTYVVDYVEYKVKEEYTGNHAADKHSKAGHMFDEEMEDGGKFCDVEMHEAATRSFQGMSNEMQSDKLDEDKDTTTGTHEGVNDRREEPDHKVLPD
ncbi:hypothetical protein L7F22_020627 [Adiantum nelumboides]|nr:hypothetical protein [Adiantum nelumboides]